MKAKYISLSLIAASLILSGCTSYKQPITRKSQFADMSASQMRELIINTAREKNWAVCDAGTNKLRVDSTVKLWRIYLDITYNETGYSITPNTRISPLVNKEGKVRKLVNAQAIRFDNYLRTAQQAHIPFYDTGAIQKCINYEPVKWSRDGFFGGRTVINTAFAWAEAPVAAGTDAKFKTTVFGGPAPQNIADSMLERMNTLQTESNRNVSGNKSAYLIKIKFTEFSEDRTSDEQEISDSMHASQQATMNVAVADPRTGKDVCYLQLTARTPTGYDVGYANRKDFAITRYLGLALWNTLEIKLMNKPEKLLTDYPDKAQYVHRPQ